MYKHIELKFECEKDCKASSRYLCNAWHAYVDDTSMGSFNFTNDSWFALFTAAGIPEKFHTRLVAYKRLLGSISCYNTIHDYTRSKELTSIKNEAQAFADELRETDEGLESVIIYLGIGEKL